MTGRYQLMVGTNEFCLKRKKKKRKSIVNLVFRVSFFISGFFERNVEFGFGSLYVFVIPTGLALMRRWWVGDDRDPCRDVHNKRPALLLLRKRESVNCMAFLSDTSRIRDSFTISNSVV